MQAQQKKVKEINFSMQIVKPAKIQWKAERILRLLEIP